ncbi:MAG: NCS2 family permease [Planctomycetota bacterium]|jgi:AGZA family xanthine/uracil permease-like MFS transporter
MFKQYFRLAQKNTDVKTEIVAGFTTFLTMAYIIFANPMILEPTSMNKSALITVTCLATAIATIIVGLVANAPIAMAPGMGLNAFFAYLVTSEQMNWQTALGVVFISGIIFLLLTLMGLRKKLIEAIPTSLVSAIAVGIGLFITFIGLTKLGIVIADKHTLVKAAPVTSATVLIGLLGLLVMLFFEMKNIRGGLLIGIVAATVMAAITKRIELPQQVISSNLDISELAFKLDIWGALKWGFFGSIFTLTFIDMFDSVGTLVACCHQADMVDENNKIKGLDRLLSIDAVATVIGALFGTSTITAYVESAAGIEQGGRSGLTSVTTGVLFLVALLLIPIVEVVPEYATAPALIMVGLFMMKEVRSINFGNLEEGFPAFIIMVMIALSYSISKGLAFGFISYALIKVVAGKAKDIKPAMCVIVLLSAVFLTSERIGDLVEYLRTVF